jgi:hypothetical protein
MSASSASSATSASSAIPAQLINIDHMFQHVFFVISAAVLLGNLEVNDLNSPGGKRTTRLYCQEMIAPNGEKVCFECWGEIRSAQVAAYFT